MLLVGYGFGIRSEHRLREAVHLNLAHRWFCRLGLTEAVPDHATFSENRHGRFRDSDLLRAVFEITVQRCIGAGLVGGEGFAVDASLIRADANKQRSADASETVDCEEPAMAGDVWKALTVNRAARSDRIRAGQVRRHRHACGGHTDPVVVRVPRTAARRQNPGDCIAHAALAHRGRRYGDVPSSRRWVGRRPRRVCRQVCW